MNKQELIEALLKKAKSASKVEAAVAITGFGTFSVTKRKARMGVNPQTGKKIKIPAMKVPKFKAGKGLKASVK